ncbi:carbohydrate ABC transporter permease [Cohnella fermenti]|uniref:Sugar ABC transporter permease n=1 Tax=Cohnella fermenti TaxID=2565925 RepID=A0A4S4BF78_9BACL|nr:sugar ABC transporter permease [Cohnella fermenti]THF72941.1 sugar ABC transporter permease [Cohnella fermenti]
MIGWRKSDFLFVAPALLVFCMFFVYPVLSSFYYSMTDWNGLSRSTSFVGFDNYDQLFRDSEVWHALWNTLKFAAAVTILQNCLSLLLAVLVDRAGRIYRMLRVYFLIPTLISALAIGFMWSYIYSPVTGVINMLLESVGLSSLTQDWLGDPKWSMLSVTFTNVWHWAGFSMIIYLAGLQGVPQEMKEAAEIDGAGAWRKFRNITFPLIAPAFTINMILTMIGSLKVFDIIYVMTKGGPGDTTTSIAILLYKKAFNFNQMGYGTAIAVVLFVIIFIFSLIQIAFLRRREVQA